MNFNFKERYDINDLIEIVKILRSPNGCPWDMQQNHHSIRRDFIEEVYEAIEAIDTEDTELLKEELGDVLLQVVFHSQIENEEKRFNFDDVADGICKKLIIRHPHVFGDVKADTTETVLKNWDSIKMKTKSQSTMTEVLKSVSKALPSLVRSDKIQKKAAKVGFDFENTEDALLKVEEELKEVREAAKSNDKSKYEEEIGDLLFSVVNVSRFMEIDSEKALYNACEKFISRFSKVELLAKERNIDINNTSSDELNTLWEEVKVN